MHGFAVLGAYVRVVCFTFGVVLYWFGFVCIAFGLASCWVFSLLSRISVVILWLCLIRGLRFGLY